ncbi:hypothetical protein BBP40_004107 [Aspergillus hancockii]|nr:hypothetical protein BBP40_004107 [Aspergillus hancockii]
MTANPAKKKWTRTRSGCITCKIRHVKCDEEKPHCYRCRSTGRTCDGYTDHRPLVSSSYIGGVSAQLTHAQRQALEFFFHQTRSCFETEAVEFLLPLVYHDAGTRLAALAVGSLHRVFMFESSGRPELRQPGMQHALQQYNRAIQHVLQQTSRSPTTLLTMCILFFCFESLQGHFKAATGHVLSGLRILHQIDGCSQSRSLDTLRSLFTTLRLQIQSYEHEGVLTNPGETLKREPEAVDLSRPAVSFEHLNTTLNLILTRLTWLLSCGYQAQPAAQCELARIYTDLSIWSRQLDQLMEVRAQTRRCGIIKSFQLRQILVHIVLRTGCTPSHSALDAQAAAFEKIVVLAEEIIADCQQSRRSGGLPSAKFLSFGIISPLWTVATKCRVSRTRHRAIAVLKRYQQREGLWDSGLYAALASRVVQLEEEAEGLTTREYLPKDISADARVTVISGWFDNMCQGRLRFLQGEGEIVEESFIW